jgi:predicted PurR-regulated permease PerM
MAGFRTNTDRVKRSRIFYTFFWLSVLAIVVLLFSALSSLILPVLIGSVAAYISLPMLTWLQQRNIPKALSIVILFGGITLAIFTIGRQIVRIIPDDKQMLELRVSVRFKINEIFLAVTGRESFDQENGNLLYSFVGDELTQLSESFNQILMLNDTERNMFHDYMMELEETTGVEPKAMKYWRELKKLPFKRIESRPIVPVSETASGTAPPVAATGDSKIGALLSAFSNWIIFPFVFIFLLTDEGEVKHFFIELVPNRYFEMTLTTLENVDTAIGKYLRGTLLECSMVGLTFFTGLSIVGFDWQAALLIGVVAGAANAIPFLGPVLGLIVGLLYAMIVETVNPMLPFLKPEDALLGVAVTVIIAQGLDNAVFQPIILGKAVNLHPLVVVIGVTGGSIIFGFVGMLFAIPAIVIINVVVSTLITQLKAYFIIY